MNMFTVRDIWLTGIRNKWVRLCVHLLLWYLLTFIYVVSLYLNSFNSSFSAFVRLDIFVLNYGLLGTINFGCFYVLVFYVFPFFLRRKKKVRLALVAIGMILAVGMAKYAISWQFRERLLIKTGYVTRVSLPKNGIPVYALPLNGPRPAGNQDTPKRVIPLSYFQGPLEYALESLLTGLMIAFAALAYRILLDWYKNEQIRKALENEKLKAELAFLKMQVNPHFLFNSLNNLYSLSVLEKTSKTSEGIMKLSEMIRYMLYEKEDEQSRVSLSKELQHLNSYIDLQRLRYENGMYLHFSTEGDVDQARIAPLLLFPLLENACKHGVVNDPLRPVTVELKVTSARIVFSVCNAINQDFKDRTGGIGLENVRKRLTLLYPGRHTIRITGGVTDFSVELHLPL